MLITSHPNGHNGKVKKQKAQMERLIDSLLKKHTQRDKEILNPYMF